MIHVTEYLSVQVCENLAICICQNSRFFVVGSIRRIDCEFFVIVYVAFGAQSHPHTFPPVHDHPYLTSNMSRTNRPGPSNKPKEAAKPAVVDDDDDDDDIDLSDPAADPQPRPLDWRIEAEAVIADVGPHVKQMCIAERLPPSRTHIFLNCTTLEGRRMCICLSARGFEVVGDAYDSVAKHGGDGGQQEEEDDVGPGRKKSIVYDTPYALLGDVSDEYIHSFGDYLYEALQNLADEEEELEDREEEEALRKAQKEEQKKAAT